ncbi:hypothetical protein AAE478_003484 [Parahypoxylon ruwenzoriense]
MNVEVDFRVVEREVDVDFLVVDLELEVEVDRLVDLEVDVFVVFVDFVLLRLLLLVLLLLVPVLVAVVVGEGMTGVDGGVVVEVEEREEALVLVGGSVVTGADDEDGSLAWHPDPNSDWQPSPQ